MAWRSGLQAVGIMDHDSYAGAAELREACRILGIASTCGGELRVNARGTFMENRLINNPDSPGIFYMALHGIAERNYHTVQQFLAPIHRARNTRNRRQLEKLNTIIRKRFPRRNNLSLNFQNDVYACSQAARGGSITERHILAALARKLMAIFPNRQRLTALLEEEFSISIDASMRAYLENEENPHCFYDLIAVLKHSLLPLFYIQPDESECIGAARAVTFARSIGAIPAYAYLGDITHSPTGDKPAARFEDSFLTELFEQLHVWGFQALTFMPPRNSKKQLMRIMELCGEYNLLQISGVDVNSSRQSFRCPELLSPEFEHLNTTTWALIAHEKLYNYNTELGFFCPFIMRNIPDVTERLNLFSRIGRDMDRRKPDLSQAEHTIHTYIQG